MEALTKLNLKHHPFIPSTLPHRPPFHHSFTSISFISHQTHRPFLKITSSINPKQTQTQTQTHKSLFSLLKTPFCITVTATALFFSTFTHRQQLLTAIASPPPPPLVEHQQTISEPEQETEASLQQRVSSNPDDVQALKSLMELKIKTKKLPEAVDIITRLIDLEPDDCEWPLLRAHIYTYMGESQFAKDGFEQILSTDPFRVEAFHGLVMAVSQGEGESDTNELTRVSKRVQEAIEMCRKEKRKDDERDLKLLIAQIRVIEGNYNEALKVYQELVKEEPRDFRPYLCQGIIYTLLRKKDEAEQQFEKYKRLVPKGHPYAQYFDDNMLATKVFSQMAGTDNVNVSVGSRG